MEIGIFGGTFNPIHIGHAIIASHVVQHSDLDQLWFMVAPLNPWKEGLPSDVSDTDRLYMAGLVARELDRVEASAFEFDLPRPSYTIDTLNALQERFPQHNFSLVIGADNWVAFDRWRAADEILARHRIIVYPRLGYEIKVPASLSHHVQVINAPIIEVSSTKIRQDIALGRDIRFLVPDCVCRYINDKKLYCNLTSSKDE